ncbi:hypothetical protein L209DRAFT_136272 [Thermothelomyces heterothallicus CBS 203.75]
MPLSSSRPGRPPWKGRRPGPREPLILARQARISTHPAEPRLSEGRRAADSRLPLSAGTTRAGHKIWCKLYSGSATNSIRDTHTHRHTHTHSLWRVREVRVGVAGRGDVRSVSANLVWLVFCPRSQGSHCSARRLWCKIKTEESTVATPLGQTRIRARRRRNSWKVKVNHMGRAKGETETLQNESTMLAIDMPETEKKKKGGGGGKQSKAGKRKEPT